MIRVLSSFKRIFENISKHADGAAALHHLMHIFPLIWEETEKAYCPNAV